MGHGVDVMAVEQLPGQVREFARYLNGLLARLDQGAGWCGVFWQRDPDGMRACLEGHEVPPWDVVEALLQDLAAEYGTGAATPEAEQARALHQASLTAFDARPGARDTLGDRLDMMLREQKYAAERLAELGRSLGSAATHEEAEGVRLDLAWAHDDQERASARCVELRYRLDQLARRAVSLAPVSHRDRDDEADLFAGRVQNTPHPTDPPTLPRQRTDSDQRRPHDGTAAWYDERGVPEQRADAEPPAGHENGRGTQRQSSDGPASAPRADAPGTPDTPAERTAPQLPADWYESPAAAEPAPVDARPASKQRAKRRTRGSARFAGMADDADTGGTPAVGPTAAPAVPEPAAPGRRTPRGARFAGAAAARPATPVREALDTDARHDTIDAVRNLVRLRGEGRSGEAHALLVEAAHWPAARFPLLAAELHRAGLGADWATLLWEAASLPVGLLVAAADALVAAGRATDGRQILRQGMARPAAEVGEAVLRLAEEGRQREVRALLDAYVRVRTAEEAARSVAADPQRLVPLLLDAARGGSEHRYRDLVHALRVAGHSA